MATTTVVVATGAALRVVTTFAAATGRTRRGRGTGEEGEEGSGGAMTVAPVAREASVTVMAATVTASRAGTGTARPAGLTARGLGVGRRRGACVTTAARGVAMRVGMHVGMAGLEAGTGESASHVAASACVLDLVMRARVCERQLEGHDDGCSGDKKHCLTCLPCD